MAVKISGKYCYSNNVSFASRKATVAVLLVAKNVFFLLILNHLKYSSIPIKTYCKYMLTYFT